MLADDVIEEHCPSPDQFVMQNFDLEWRGYSFGVQPDVDHFAAAAAFDIVGIDIYHPSQGDLTGVEIAFGGDLTRSLKRANYFVVETQAQGFAHWTPYPGQLRLQAFSHLASGANMVAYWHWHSIHNSFETYRKGLLSHDLAPNPVYEEARTIGADFARLSAHLSNLHKPNKVAVLVSNEALSGIERFQMTSFKRHYGGTCARGSSAGHCRAFFRMTGSRTEEGSRTPDKGIREPSSACCS